MSLSDPTLPSVAIATTGRFHVLDLARELAAIGHRVQFYSYVPRERAEAFGLPGGCHVGLADAAAPYLGWSRFAPGLAPDLRRRLLYSALNRALARRLEPCDILVCMSGVYLEAAAHARAAFGAKVFLERGSMHAAAQRKILAAVSGSRQMSEVTFARELAGYHLADRIVVPSRHVAESFEDDQAACNKLFVNPYGVDLSMFPQRPTSPTPGGRRLIYVGTWSYQKGCDILIEALDRLPGAVLTHVGAIGDAPFPHDHPSITHVDPVDQSSLSQFYRAADLFVLASRQDGFGLVMTQALASGLPVVGTDRTGATTLMAQSKAFAQRVRAAPAGDAAAFAAAVETALADIAAGRMPEIPPKARTSLSWRAYAERYSAELVRMLSGAAPAGALSDLGGAEDRADAG